MAKTGTSAIYSRRTLKFLKELADNNERAWFEGNKGRYEADVLEPSLELIETMGPRLERISKHFVAIPKRSGGSLMRVYRDMRFSRDNTPYKTNVGIQFRHELGRDVHAPGFYVHIEPGGCFIGAGIWHPAAEPLAAIRSRIAESPDEWRRAVTGKRFRDAFELSGDRLTRPPRGFAADAPHIEDIKRRDFIAIRPLGDADVVAADLPRQLHSSFTAAKPLMSFLCAALDLRF